LSDELERASAPASPSMSAPTAYIGVIGGGEAEGPELELAREVGARLAQADAVLVCGGLGGAMAAACSGAKQHHGLTIGVLPGSDRAAANPDVDVALPTGLGELRNGLLVRFSDALIAIGGGWGTLSEIAFAMRTGRPVVALSAWEALLEEVSRAVSAAAGSSGLGTPATAPWRHAADAEEAVGVALALARDHASAAAEP
jgi:uncharacterized protein (TIGR00725 family)